MAVENDIVLIYHEDKPLTFARIEEILPDHKPDWYHVRLLILQLPLNAVTWILRDVYINGETFTMGGKTMRLALVETPEPITTEDDLALPISVDEPKEKNKRPPEKAKVISLADLKKNNGR